MEVLVPIPLLDFLGVVMMGTGACQIARKTGRGDTGELPPYVVAGAKFATAAIFGT
jgi:hypothetical protein